MVLEIKVKLFLPACPASIRNSLYQALVNNIIFALIASIAANLVIEPIIAEVSDAWIDNPRIASSLTIGVAVNVSV